MWIVPDVTPLIRINDLTLKLTTAISERDKALQENLALSAEVEALKSQLSQCRDEMASYCGIATETAAGLGELLREAEYRHDQISLKKAAEGLLVERSYVRRIQFLLKLRKSWQNATALQLLTSQSGALAGTAKAPASCCQCCQA